MRTQKIGLWRRSLVVGGILILFLSGCAGLAESRREEIIRTIGPSPRLSPTEVVHIQMTAFEYNDSANSGIEIAYRFASPRNKSAIGSLRRYIRLINSRAFRPMLGPKSVTYDDAIINGTVATVRIYLTSQDDFEIVYVFTLSSQNGDTCEGCWMTDEFRIERVQQIERQNTI